MFAILATLLLMPAFIGGVWLIGTAWTHFWWVRDGKPNLTNDEKLAIDMLRAQGLSATGARRSVIARRDELAMYRHQITTIKEAGSLLEGLPVSAMGQSKSDV